MICNPLATQHPQGIFPYWPIIVCAVVPTGKSKTILKLATSSSKMKQSVFVKKVTLLNYSKHPSAQAI